jgi:hypothetical protein
LIHFTKGQKLEEAFNNLCSIISSCTVYGSNNFIKGGSNCVCFSEAPIGCISNGLINNEYYSKYSPFGIMVKKDWLFYHGGRPVIYQTEEEFNLLPEGQRWRHMTYNPISVPPVDFTWEREWRILTAELSINPADCSIIMPNADWADALIMKHRDSQEWEIQEYKTIFQDETIVELFRNDFQWTIYLLDDRD